MKYDSKDVARALVLGTVKYAAAQANKKICSNAEARHLLALSQVIKTLNKGDTNGK